MKRLSIAIGSHRQRGATAVEFALVAAAFLTLLIGIMEMGRVLFYWNSAAEATRWGARLAVVCDLNDSEIKTRMRQMLPILSPGDISVNYEPSACAADAETARSTCQGVTVSILPSLTVDTAIPFVPLSLPIPPFSTSLPRESMDSALGTNPVCT